MSNLFHTMTVDGELPEHLNNPFDYEPHPLCVEAARRVCDYVAQSQLYEEVMLGKMLGVLVCQTSDEIVGFLAAYSGQLGGREDWPWFVPAVFNYLQPDGYFKQEEARITAINANIAQRELSPAFIGLKETLQRQQQQAAQEIEAFRQQMAEKKRLRDERRRKLQTPPPAPPLGGEGSVAEAFSLEREGSAGEVLSLEVEGSAAEVALIRESQFQKAELRRLKERWHKTIAETEAALQPLQDEVTRLRQERRKRSDALQRWLFDQFVMLNCRGEQRTLTDIFAHTPQRVPPAGTGECCAPKLLQYAFAHGLKPLCMAEFWQGASPAAEVRHHGSFYPACRGKCKPVLEWMLEPTPSPSQGEGSLISSSHEKTDRRVSPSVSESGIRMIFEDDSLLVVDKPAGLLSVPGKTGEASVESLLRAHYGEVFMVHRLDQDTSGLMVVARTREAHRRLQQQFLFASDNNGLFREATDYSGHLYAATDYSGLFKEAADYSGLFQSCPLSSDAKKDSPLSSDAQVRARAIFKMYIALLDGTVEGNGTIRLPLRPDVDERPRQMVDHAHGKKAVTDYEVLGHEDAFTRVALTPHTGRTHQLRMHCAHQEGLGVPIVGDRLYGHSTAKGQRLCLHAAALSFIHPQTRQRLTFNSDPPF